jgi:acyl carrier protein
MLWYKYLTIYTKDSDYLNYIEGIKLSIREDKDEKLISERNLSFALNRDELIPFNIREIDGMLFASSNDAFKKHLYFYICPAFVNTKSTVTLLFNGSLGHKFVVERDLKPYITEDVIFQMADQSSFEDFHRRSIGLVPEPEPEKKSESAMELELRDIVEEQFEEAIGHDEIYEDQVKMMDTKEGKEWSNDFLAELGLDESPEDAKEPEHRKTETPDLGESLSARSFDTNFSFTSRFTRRFMVAKANRSVLNRILGKKGKDRRGMKVAYLMLPYIKDLTFVETKDRSAIGLLFEHIHKLSNKDLSIQIKAELLTIMKQIRGLGEYVEDLLSNWSF